MQLYIGTYWCLGTLDDFQTKFIVLSLVAEYVVVRNTPHAQVATNSVNHDVMSIVLVTINSGILNMQ